MSRPTFDLSLTTERRALDAPPRIRRTPAGEVATGAGQPALTAREEKVRQLLLRELSHLNTNERGFNGLSYLERKKLRDTLDVNYIDEELERIQKHRRWAERAFPVLLALTALVLLGVVITSMAGGDLSTLWTLPLIIGANAITAHVQRRSLRRKQFIYEALRELSGADEADVLLDRATQDADALIRRITDRALAHERRWTPRHPR